MSPAARRTVTTPSTAAPNTVADPRIEVRKTYKLYIDGAFPRSESGRTYEVRDSHDRFLANAAMGSRKLARVLGGVNPVAGPYFNISAPEPTGVVAALAPQRSSLLGLVSVLAPIVVSGNTAVVLTSENRPLPAVTLCEVLATSDVPAGVINVISGRTAEVAPWLAAHQDVNAIDLAGAADADDLSWALLERASAENLKRVLRPAGKGTDALEPDWSATPDLTRVKAYLETKTVWHPKGR